jgi:hypothetical protein
VNNEFNDLTDSLKLHEVSFRLVPTQLSGFKCAEMLNWKNVQFRQEQAESVPNSRGVYAFIIESAGNGLPPHGYVMYVGKAGDGRHSLKKRFNDYFQEQKRPKRPRIYRMLTRWHGVLSFYFAQIENPAIELTDIERSLNDALLPPFSRNDFSAGMRKAVNAFEI